MSADDIVIYWELFLLVICWGVMIIQGRTINRLRKRVRMYETSEPAYEPAPLPFSPPQSIEVVNDSEHGLDFLENLLKKQYPVIRSVDIVNQYIIIGFNTTGNFWGYTINTNMADGGKVYPGTYILTFYTS